MENERSVEDCARLWAGGYDGIGVEPPPDPGEYPDGPEILGALPAYFRSGSVLEFGCGYGRLAHLFDAGSYRGVDFSITAIDRARRRLPGYDFRTCGLGEPLPAADGVFAYAVLHHIPAAGLPALALRLRAAAPRFVLVERMGDIPDTGRKFPAWHRTSAEYIDLFRGVGFRAFDVREFPYKAPRGQTITAIDFRA